MANLFTENLIIGWHTDMIQSVKRTLQHFCFIFSHLN